MFFLLTSFGAFADQVTISRAIPGFMCVENGTASTSLYRTVNEGYCENSSTTTTKYVMYELEIPFVGDYYYDIVSIEVLLRLWDGSTDEDLTCSLSVNPVGNTYGREILDSGYSLGYNGSNGGWWDSIQLLSAVETPEGTLDGSYFYVTCSLPNKETGTPAENYHSKIESLVVTWTLYW